MKINHLPLFLFLGIILNSNYYLMAQFTEDFESETVGSKTFSDNGQNFTISNGRYKIAEDVDFEFGWNGIEADNKFIDNYFYDGDANFFNTNNGSSFRIFTTDGAYIHIISFYLFVSKHDFSEGLSTTLAITGKKDGNVVYTVNKSTGILDGAIDYDTNNGYTFINLTTEGGADNSNIAVDEIIISSTGNGDYMALDAFTWKRGEEVLTADSFEIKQNKVKIFPNPSFDFIQISGLKKTENYQLYTISGKEINKGTISNDEKIDIQNLRSGFYFLKLNNDTIKFLKK